MPDPSEILIGLARTADAGFLLAVAWHVVIAIAVLALLAGWRPERRTAALLLSAPLASVSLAAWAHASAFNAVVFAALAVTLVALAARAPRRPVAAAPPWAQALGGLLIAFAWLYPHFLDGWPTLAYLAGAPVGVIPCPTLALLSGFALLGDGPGGRAWSAVLAGAGLFYGLVGVGQLGVWLDTAVIVGGVAVASRAVLVGRAANAPRL